MATTPTAATATNTTPTQVSSPSTAPPTNAASNPAAQTGSLYVGDLNPDVTETMLFELFKGVGAVASIRVCRDAVTRRSLGYAYINFHNATDAERALDTLNYHSLRGKTIRIMWSHRDPSLRKSGQGNVFIKNLDKSIDNKALYDMFSAFGNILSCKVATDDLGQSRGYGFVHYETAEAGENAIAKVNGMQLNGKIVYVGLFQSRRDRDGTTGADGERKFTNLYVKNLPDSVDTNRLREMFSKFGTVTSAVVQTDGDTKSRCFGFINFETPEAAKAACDEMSGKEVDGKVIYAGRAQKKGEREAELRSRFEQLKLERIAKEAGVNLYIKNLDDQIDDEKLRSEFSQFGQITSAHVMRDDKTNISKGFGFVCFTTPEEATKAVTEMNGRMLGSKPIYVALAQRKEVRRAQLESFHRAQQNMARGFASQMYPPPMGAPVYYPPGPGGFVGYPQAGNMVPRPRWNPQQGQPMARGAGFQQMPNYVMPMAQAGGRGGPRGPRGPVVPGQPGMQQPGMPPMHGGRAGIPPQLAAGGRPMQQNAMPQSTADGREMKYDLKSGAVNAPRPGAPAPTQPKGDVPMQLPPPLNPAILASVPAEDRKQFIGESLFPLIGNVQPNHAGKITGMLLESMQIPELLHLLENPSALHSKIEEAVQVLQHAELQGGADE